MDTSRRGFLGALLAVPLLGRLVPRRWVSPAAAPPAWTIRYAPQAFDSAEPPVLQSSKGCRVTYERGLMIVTPTKPDDEYWYTTR